MKRQSLDPLEPERYELQQSPSYRFLLGRREFFHASGAGLLVLMICNRTAQGQESGRRGRSSNTTPQDIQAWLHIGEEGKTTVFTGKVEVGQNIRTSLAQAVAEELRCPLKTVSLVMGDTDRTPYDRGTFGSRSTPVMAPQLRKMAAAARQALLEEAAQRWNVAADSLEAEGGSVRDPQASRSLSYGQLTQGRPITKEVVRQPELTLPQNWRILGQSVRKVEGESFVTGRHRFTSDMSLPGMLHGKVVRPPAYGATLAAADFGPGKPPAGVTRVRDGNFVGVAAPTLELAESAARSVKAEWKTQAEQPNNDQLFDYLKSNLRQEGGWRARGNHETGSVEEVFANSDRTLAKTYHIAYIAHAPLEPRAALASWEEGKLTVWTGTQRPFGVRAELAEAFRLPEEKIRVLVPDTGSGYGGKHTGEAAVEAARLAKAAGKPVKLVWTREEEFAWAYFRPAGVIEIRSAVGSDGLLRAWEHHNYNSGGSGIRTPYHVEHQKIQFHPTESPLRQGSYRALAATANHFARETHLDEWARDLNIDPLEFRLKNLRDDRLQAVLKAAAKAFGWSGRKARKGVGYGIAGGFEKGGYVGTCAEVAVNADGHVKVRRVAAAFECGAVVNPNHLKSQVEGAVVQGIGGALFEAIEFADGRLLNGLFSRYRLPRFSDAPEIDVVLVDRRDLPSAGAGETPIVGVAPAVGSAIFDAVGLRLRSLPLASQGLTRKDTEPGG